MSDKKEETLRLGYHARLPKNKERAHRKYTWPDLKAAQKEFLNYYIAEGSIAGAHQRSRASRNNHYYWLKTSEAYQIAYADARLTLQEELEAKLYARATEGFRRPVIYQGQPMHAPQRNDRGQIVKDASGHTCYENEPMCVAEPSDNCLMFLLKKLDPSYRDNSKVELTGQGGGPLKIEIVRVKPGDESEVSG